MMTYRIATLALLLALVLPVFNARAETPGLTIERGPAGKPYLAYGGRPLLAFGPGDEMRLINGAADIERWAAWQKENGMNLVRAYPVSVPLERYGAPGPHPFMERDGKWDVDAFNDDYFNVIRDKAEILENHGIILHLQLWQIVFFKGGGNRWDINHIRPNNNVNEWTQAFRRGHDYIDAPDGSRAREHQREWVRRILDALKGRNNVLIDVINELGNEMGSLEWASVVVGWIREWEAENEARLIVGVDSEHHYKPEQFGVHRGTFDLIILNELRSRSHALGAIRAFDMPAVSVRSSDGRNQRHDYMFVDENQVGPEHQTRYRMLCYRSIFAGLQSIGAYWKPEVQKADYADMAYWPRYARALRAFWNMIEAEWPVLQPDDEVVAAGAVTPHIYALRSDNLLAVYLEAGSHTWNNQYEASNLELVVDKPVGRAVIFNPRTGEQRAAEPVREPHGISVQLPAFTDDLALLLWFE